VTFPLSFTPKTEAELGKQLFFDPILSGDRSISCGSCHKPEYGFADNVPFSFGIDSTKTTRNTPTVKNVLARSRFFWDGRANTLEEQALKPIENPDEMNLPISVAVERLNNNPQYRRAFKRYLEENRTH
jgi:cytochrome c peroxidase